MACYMQLHVREGYETNIFKLTPANSQLKWHDLVKVEKCFLHLITFVPLTGENLIYPETLAELHSRLH